MDIAGLVIETTTWILPALLAITLHEAAHGYVAWILGDDTARQAGRVSFNPLRHVDPIGTILIPGMLLLVRAPFLIGWARPVPVSLARLRNPRRDMVLVAAAGPGINILIAIVSALGFHLLDHLPSFLYEWLALNLENSLRINVMLAVFNLIPLPPLDGGRIAVGVLPAPLSLWLARLEPYGMAILLAAVFVLPLIASQFGYGLPLLSLLLAAPVRWMIETIVSLTAIA